MVIMNGSSGKQDNHALQPKLVELFALPEGAVEFTLLGNGKPISDAVREAAAGTHDVLVAAGGDGTISAVAAIAVEKKRTLGVLPLGTHNHFARDLGIPLELADAVRVIRDGHSTVIDVGEVNGGIFINNSSVGLYPAIVRHRDEQRRQQDRPKWLALAIAILEVAWKRFPMVNVTLTADGHVLHRRTPVVFVGNNEYESEKRDIGTRACLDGGKLCIFVAHATRPVGLLYITLRALAGLLRPSRHFDRLVTTEATIECHRSEISVSKDGEVTRLRTPLEYRIRPQALRVIVPPPGAEQKP